MQKISREQTQWNYDKIMKHDKFFVKKKNKKKIINLFRVHNTCLFYCGSNNDKKYKLKVSQSNAVENNQVDRTVIERERDIYF